MTLPEDVERWIIIRAREIHEERQRARSLLDEQRGILKLAKKYGIKTAEFMCEESDDDLTIRHAREFCLEGDDIPFFCEMKLYDLLGKEDARTVLAIVDQLIRQISG